MPEDSGTNAPPDPVTGAPERGWTPRPWRPEAQRTDLVQVGRFTHERALRQPDLGVSPGAHHVAAVLASYGDARGRNIFPSQRTLAQVCRRSERHIRAKLRELTELGLVRRLSHGGGRPSYRHGRRRRVTPARYELTLPAGLVADDDSGSQRKAGSGAAPRRHEHASGPPTGESSSPATGTRPGPAPARAAGTTTAPAPRELSASVLEQVRAALGDTTVTEPQARAALAAALDRARGSVTNPVAYALAVVRSDPAAFRPTPDVTEPRCPLHPEHPTTRCPACAAACSEPSAAWRRMRERMRHGRDP